MDQKLLHRLRVWRARQAQKEGVELFRVLPNTTLEEIARMKPLTPEAFFHIKGIKEGRWMKYGSMLLAMVRDAAGPQDDTDAPTLFQNPEEENVRVSSAAKRMTVVSETLSLFGEIEEEADADTLAEATENKEENADTGRTLYTVSSFLEAMNGLFAAMTVRIKGEVSSVDKRDRVVYFSLKDSQDESVLNCLAFRYHYDISGVNLEVGQEVIVEGTPEIWKPAGRFSLKVQLIEVEGEGALKKAYDELKLKLEREGIFAVERKRALPEFPERIALITSNQGAAIGDFMMNLGSYGFKIRLLNSSVEGKRAVFELIEAVRYFNRHPEEYDVLVMIRGGGSLESLQAFNNEALVREVVQSRIPVLCGIGHEKDVSLVALAADVMVSTPTATARTLREPWEKAVALLEHYERFLLTHFQILLQDTRRKLERSAVFLLERLRILQERFSLARHRLLRSCETLGFGLRAKREAIAHAGETLQRQYIGHLETVTQKLKSAEDKLEAHNPERLLRLGYSLVMHKGKLVRHASEVKAGETIVARLASGSLEAQVTERYEWSFERKNKRRKA
jgi:exodeoxyribonuclease VII large subunit